MNLQEMTFRLKLIEREGKILKVTRSGLLTGYAETLDGKISFERKRIGGGFTVGNTFYEIKDQNRVMNVLTEDVAYAYKTLLESLQSAGLITL